jgi:hypothetical protein
MTSNPECATNNESLVRASCNMGFAPVIGTSNQPLFDKRVIQLYISRSDTAFIEG